MLVGGDMKLYAYSFPAYFAKGWIKVGDTTRTVEQRVLVEQDDTQNPEKPFVIKTWNIGQHNDHDIHKILKANKFIRIRENREWFECTVEDVDRAVNQLLLGISRKDCYGMREEQEGCVTQAFDYYQNGGKEFLVNAKMRYGKTFVGYHTMKKLSSKNTLVLTYKPSTADGWEDDLDNHVAFVDYKFYRAMNYSKTNPIVFNHTHNVLFASFQDILGKNFDGDIKDKFSYIFDIDFDFLILDEVHFGVGSARAQEFLSRIKAKKIMAMSGTPVKLLMNGFYSEEQIYSWTYADEQKKRKIEKSLGWQTEIYRWLAEMSLYIYRVGDMVKADASFYTDEEGLTLRKFFKDLTLINQFLDKLAIQNNKVFKSPLVIKKHKHMFWYLSDVECVNVLAEELRNHIFFGKRYKIIVAADKNEGEGKNTLKVVKDYINKVEKNFEIDGNTYIGTITLSCGKLNTGVSVQEWDSVWMMNDGSAVETYMQTIFRCQTPWEDGKKEIATVYDFNPNRALSMLYDYSLYTARGKNDTVKTTRELLDCLNVYAYEDGDFITKDVNDVISAGTVAGNAIRRFSSDTMFNIYGINDSVKKILENVGKTSHSVNSIDLSQSDIENGKTFDGVEGNPKASEEDGVKAEDSVLKARTVVKMIPNFMFCTNEKEESVSDIINTKHTSVFKDIVGVSVEDFGTLVDSGFINKTVMNKAIESFLVLENS